MLFIVLTFLNLYACAYANAQFKCTPTDVTSGGCPCFESTTDCTRMTQECFCNPNCGCISASGDTIRYKEHPNADCLLPKKVGHCRAAIPRYYYDWQKGECVTFLYGGCAPNANNFKSNRLCERTCIGGDWVPLEPSRVCFGATEDSYGTVKLPIKGYLTGLKLVNVRGGYVSCNKNDPSCNSKWGCDCFPQRFLSVFVTDDKERILFPTSVKETEKWYTLPGFNSTSDTIVFTDTNSPMCANSGTEIKVWYGEDLYKYTVENNSGRVCALVYGRFIKHL